MCIIIGLEPLDKMKVDITKEVLEFAWKSNMDGGGFSFIRNVDKQKERELCINKSYNTFSNFYRSFSKSRIMYPKSMFLVHFRYASQGDKSAKNCHPFKINDKLVMAHNGTITKMDSKLNVGLSDSFLFAKMLSKLPSKWYANPSYVELIKSYIGKNNKIAFLTIENKIKIFNADSWIKEDHIWYSNDYYKKERFTTNSTVTVTPEKSNIIIATNSSSCIKDDVPKCSKCNLELVMEYERKNNMCAPCIEKEARNYNMNVYGGD